MIDGEFSRLRLQGMLDQLYQDQETAHNQELARQEALQKQLESVNYAMPTAQASSSYGDWNPMTGAPGNTIGSTITGTTNGIDPNDPYGIKALLGNQTTNPVTTPVLTGAEALGPPVTWDGVDKRMPNDPFGIRQLLANAGTQTVQNFQPTTTPQTTTPLYSGPYAPPAPTVTTAPTTTGTTSSTSITGDSDPYGLKALFSQQSGQISNLSNDLSFVKQQAQPKQNMGFAKDPYSNEQWTPSDMYKNNVPRETQSFNTSGSGLGSLIRGA